MKRKHLACQNLSSITNVFSGCTESFIQEGIYGVSNICPVAIIVPGTKEPLRKYYLNEWINEDHKNEKETISYQKEIKA